MTTLITRYTGAGDATGATVRVTETSTRRQRTYPYDYAARDAHESAAREFARYVLGIEKPTVTEDTSGRTVSRGKRFTVAGTTATYHGVVVFDSVDYATDMPLAYVTDGASYGAALDGAYRLAVRQLRNGATQCAARGDADGAASMYAAMERIGRHIPNAEYAFSTSNGVGHYRVRVTSAAVVTE